MKHRDSEKDKKMFGTLIIQPPSTHTGGELVVYEANGKSNKVIVIRSQRVESICVSIL